MSAHCGGGWNELAQALRLGEPGVPNSLISYAPLSAPRSRPDCRTAASSLRDPDAVNRKWLSWPLAREGLDIL